MTDAMFLPLIKDTPWPAKAGTRIALGALPGAASTAAIAELAERADTQRPIVVLVASSSAVSYTHLTLPTILLV